MGEEKRDRWQVEYDEFAACSSAAPPRHVSDAVCDRIRRELNPSPLQVFAKLCAATILGGALSLALCPQFGYGITRHNHTLMHLFALLGPAGCMAACGGIFLGISAALAAVTLRVEELKLVQRSRFLQIPVIALGALSFFVCAGAEVLILSALAWWLGAVTAGVLTLELGCTARFHLRGVSGNY